MIAVPIRRRRRWARGTAVALGLAACAAGGAAWLVSPPQPGSGQSRLVVVRRGDSAEAVASRLKAAGLVRSAWAVAWLSRVEGLSRHLTAGVYRLSPAMSAIAILQRLKAGRVAVVRVTVPEGQRVAEVVARLERAGIGSPAAWRNALAHPVSGLPAPAPGVRDPFEGYLYPATYAFSPLTSPTQALATMVRTFHQHLRAMAAPRGLTLRQWVTLASIVQAEGRGRAVDQAVAAVFLNRLARHMPLDSDATVRYAVGNWTRPLTAAELAVDSPYNTYRHPDLPPGPIDNPGAVALWAVAHPAKVGYLYFVSTPDGRYLFANTYAQHLKNVARAQASQR
jgi:UPF0755 protein